MPITGSWKNSPAATGGETQRNFQPRNNWGDGVDPRHDVATPHTQWSDADPTMVYPDFHVEVPPFLEDSFNISYIPPTFPPEFSEPDGHDGIQTAPWGVTDQRSQVTNNAARSADRGMAKWAVRRHTIGRGSTETFDSQRTQSSEAPQTDLPGPGQAERALRGKNALALNNPGNAETNFSGNYTRAGWEQHRWTNRWMPRRTLSHTKRMLHLNLATTAMPSAAPQGDSYNPYTSPFDGRTTQMVAKRQKTMARREPRPWDEDITTDGSAGTFQSDTSQYNSWGL